MTNLTIANIFLFFAILCLALSAMVSRPLYFIYSFGATVAGGRSAPRAAAAQSS